MSESYARLPLDYRESVSFKRLNDGLKESGLCGELVEVWATYFYVKLWRALGLLQKENGTCGRLLASEVGFLTDQFSPFPEPGKAFELLVSPARLLQPDGSDYICSRYAELNAEMLRSGEKTMHAKGGIMKRFNKMVRKATEENSQQSLNIQADRLKDADGVPLSPDEIRKVYWAIMVMDAALGKPEREGWNFHATLIQNAAVVIRKFDEKQIDHVGRLVATRREHPVLAKMNTEHLLPIFHELAAKLTKPG